MPQNVILNIDCGVVRPSMKGDWDPAATYSNMDLVRYNNTVYQCVSDNVAIGVAPENDEGEPNQDWVAYLISVPGPAGPKGDKGDPGSGSGVNILAGSNIEVAKSGDDVTVSLKTPVLKYTYVNSLFDLGQFDFGSIPNEAIYLGIHAGTVFLDSTGTNNVFYDVTNARFHRTVFLTVLNPIEASFPDTWHWKNGKSINGEFEEGMLPVGAYLIDLEYLCIETEIVTVASYTKIG